MVGLDLDRLCLTDGELGGEDGKAPQIDSLAVELNVVAVTEPTYHSAAGFHIDPKIFKRPPTCNSRGPLFLFSFVKSNHERRV